MKTPREIYERMLSTQHMGVIVEAIEKRIKKAAVVDKIPLTLHLVLDVNTLRKFWKTPEEVPFPLQIPGARPIFDLNLIQTETAYSLGMGCIFPVAAVAVSAEGVSKNGPYAQAAIESIDGRRLCTTWHINREEGSWGKHIETLSSKPKSVVANDFLRGYLRGPAAGFAVYLDCKNNPKLLEEMKARATEMGRLEEFLLIQQVIQFLGENQDALNKLMERIYDDGSVEFAQPHNSRLNQNYTQN